MLCGSFIQYLNDIGEVLILFIYFHLFSGLFVKSLKIYVVSLLQISRTSSCVKHFDVMRLIYSVPNDLIFLIFYLGCLD